MAPEQLAGAEVTPRSDIYALGLVLYEIFTGQRALDGSNLAELIHKREQSGITPPTRDREEPRSEDRAAILRCLKPRAGATAGVGARRRGGAAGRRSARGGARRRRDAVAGHGRRRRDRPKRSHPAIGLALVAVIVAGLIAFGAMSDRHLLYSYAPMKRSIGFLDDRAREIAASLGYTAPPWNSARASASTTRSSATSARRTISDAMGRAAQRAGVGDAVPPARESRSCSCRSATSGCRRLGNPPPTTSRHAADDPRRSRPAGVLRSGAAAAWIGNCGAGSRAVDRALRRCRPRPRSRFRPADPIGFRARTATEWLAWEGTLADRPDVTLRVEASAYKDMPVSFRILGPWTQPEQPPAPPPPQRFSADRTADARQRAPHFARWCSRGATCGPGAATGVARGPAFRLHHATWIAAWVVGARHYRSASNRGRPLLRVLRTCAVQRDHPLAALHRARALHPALLAGHPDFVDARAVGPDRRPARRPRSADRSSRSGSPWRCWALLVGRSLPDLLGLPPPTPRATNLRS